MKTPLFVRLALSLSEVIASFWQGEFMGSKILALLILFASFPTFAYVGTTILCNGKDSLGRDIQVSYLVEAKTISIKENPSQPWKIVFDNVTSCGRVSNYDCQHTAYDNFEDSSSPNKHAYDSIACTRNGSGAINGQLEANFFSNGGGQFWCSIYGTMKYSYKLTECSYKKTP